MLPELQQLIINNSMRRMKKDVGLQLPPVFLTSMVVDGDTEEIRALLADHPGLEQAIVHAIKDGGLSFLDAQHVSTLRRLVGEAKAIPYANILIEELDIDTDKRVVFGLHTKALVSLRDHLWKNKIQAVLVNGTTSEKERIAAVKAFQEDPECRVFIGNIRAAGVGLTLTAACEIDMMESDWTPAGNAQAIMRVHRIGQTRNVRGRFVTLSRSIDEVVNRVVAAKTAAIAQVDGGELMHSAPHAA
jgi:SNF2 family DNA or RNA helicase